MEPYIEIPTWDNQDWGLTVFDTREEYVEFVTGLFKEPGQYEFDETSLYFNEQARKFNRQGYYCNFPFKSKDFISYWDFEKLKCRKGVIFKSEGKTWYLTRDYYMWINFLPIFDKAKKRFDFPEVWDTQYHMALYELLAELNYKHIALLKKRQLGSSYFHCSKIINLFWFESGAVLKVGASLKDYINEKGIWKFLNEYRNFLNENTAWYRPCDPDKVHSWQQRIKVRTGGRDSYTGLKSTITGTSFEKDPTASVGGACLTAGHLIWMANGTLKKVEDIVAGDYILGIDNKPKKVTRLFRGEADVYDVVQSLGLNYTVTYNHRLYLKSNTDITSITPADWMSLPDVKQQELKGINKSGTLSDISLIYAGVQSYYGFECEDHLYMLEDGTITHNCSIFYHEEAGIAPKMGTTYEYIRPSLQSGMITTGIFIAAGSVGDLDQCQPLKDMIINPSSNSIYAVTSDLLNEHKVISETGLFIPEQWSMPPFIDKFGNSLVKEAEKAIIEERLQWKKDLSPDKYQLRISQKPMNIEEAFATRKESVFPRHLVAAQLKRIEDKQYPVEYVELERNDLDKINILKSNKSPITEFPISKKTENKEGVICIWERPIKDAPWGTYYASIDPVSDGKTVSSDSLCSIVVYKNAIEVTKDDGNGNFTTYVERDRIVATWCGRFDDLKKTHERLEMIIELYNAWTIVEVNISLFIQYMIFKRKQKYLVQKDQVLFLKDLSNQQSYQDYGWKNTGNFFKNNLLTYGVQFLEEEIDRQTKPNGEIESTTYGVERIPDPMLLKEMQAYYEGLNVDRLVSFCALVAFATVQQSNRGMKKRIEVSNDKLENPEKISKFLERSPFRNMGRNNPNSTTSPKRNPFKNYR